LIYLLNIKDEKHLFDDYRSIQIISAACDGCLLIIIIISTLKCVGNYGQGFKEMILKQRIFDKSADFDMTTNVNFDASNSKGNDI
jgi:hypothetical protein